MTPIVYFFGTLANGYDQYPTDYTRSLFPDFLKQARGEVQIVVKRVENLLHYGYVRRVANGRKFGLAVVTNVVIADTEHLFDVFDNAFAFMVERGVALRVDGQGKVVTHATALADEKVSLDLLSHTLQKDVRHLITRRGCMPLPPPDFSHSVSDVAKVSLEDGKEVITAALCSYTNVFISKTQAEIAAVTSFQSQMGAMQSQMKEAAKTIRKLEGEKSRLTTALAKERRKKKQLTKVFVLLGLLLVGIAVAVHIISGKDIDLRARDTYISRLQNSLKVKTDSIAYMDFRIETLRAKVQAKAASFDSLSHVVNAKDDEIEQLTDENDELGRRCTRLQAERDAMEVRLKTVMAQSSATPSASSSASHSELSITEIRVGNVDKNNNVETPYGGSIRSKNTMYLRPKVYYTTKTTVTRTLTVKWFTPSGTYTQNSESYTFPASSSVLYLIGYGNTKKGNWPAGNYRVEIWAGSTLLCKSSFYIR